MKVPSPKDYIEINRMVEEAISIYEKLNNHYATRTRPLFENRNTLEVLSKLMISGDLQQGFKILCQNKKQEKSFENIVITFSKYFDTEIINAAKWRLDHWKELIV
jgi:hypothetical protein